MQSPIVTTVTPNQSSLIKQFKTSCLQQITKKCEQLTSFQQSSTTRLQQQSQALINNLSKVLIQLQDEVVQILRENIKVIFQSQQKSIKRQFQDTNEVVCQRIQEEIKQLHKMKQIVQQNLQGSKKILTKFIQGKFHSNHSIFTQYIQSIKLQQRPYNYDYEQLSQQVQQIVQLLGTHRSLKVITPGISESLVKSKLTIKDIHWNNSYASHQYQRQNEEKQGIEKQGQNNQDIAESVSIQNQQKLQNKLEQKTATKVDSSAINQFVQQKKRKKMSKLEQYNKTGGIKSQKSGISMLAQLMFAKQKLLKELE